MAAGEERTGWCNRCRQRVLARPCSSLQSIIEGGRYPWRCGRCGSREVRMGEVRAPATPNAPASAQERGGLEVFSRTPLLAQHPMPSARQQQLQAHWLALRERLAAHSGALLILSYVSTIAVVLLLLHHH